MSCTGWTGRQPRQCTTVLQPRRRVRHRDTVEVIVGAVLGPIRRPEAVIAARYRGDELVQVGRTVPLSARQAADLGAVLEPADADHPWPDEIGAGRWQKVGATVPLTKVAPTVVVEVAADAARQSGQWRHGLRLVRRHPDIDPADVDPADELGAKGLGSGSSQGSSSR